MIEDLPFIFPTVRPGDTSSVSQPKQKDRFSTLYKSLGRGAKEWTQKTTGEYPPARHRPYLITPSFLEYPCVLLSRIVDQSGKGWKFVDRRSRYKVLRVVNGMRGDRNGYLEGFGKGLVPLDSYNTLNNQLKWSLDLDFFNF